VRFKRLPFIRGKGAYNLSLLYNLFRGIHQPYKVTIDGQTFDGRYTMLVACNGSFYGGGFNPVPEAVPDDGFIDFLLAGALSPFSIAGVVGKFQSGQYKDLPQYLTHMRGRRMDIVCARGNAVNIDGETITANQISFSLSDKRLNFFAPRGAFNNLHQHLNDCEICGEKESILRNR
jgi:diacylglycerol kinase family enzyme